MAARDGIVQLDVDGQSTWLVLDAASRTCAVIDPLEPLVGRIADFIRAQRYHVRALVETHSHLPGVSGRNSLMLLLEDQLDGAASTHSMGWPSESGCISLGNGMLVNAVTLGGQLLARLPREEGMFDSVSYLLGVPDEDKLLARSEVRYAFTGSSISPRLAGVVGARTILCGAGAAGAVPCTTLAAQQHVCVKLMAERRLDESTLRGFLDAHPEALLIDVREAYEHVAAGASAWHGRKAHSVPLSLLADRLPAWLGGEQRPLVFFCRTGGRSASAAECLQRLGYQAVWHVAGGLTLANARKGEVPLAA